MQKKTVIGAAEYIRLKHVSQGPIPARIDTGARTSTIWASKIVESGKTLEYVLFDPTQSGYSGETLRTDHFSKIVVASSTGEKQVRFKIPITITLKGRTIRTYCTLADRSTQVYPVLIGRNTLNGKFIVDVQNGSKVLKEMGEQKSIGLQADLESGTVV